jgi:hypothetical protein
MTAEEFQALVLSVKANGLREKVKLTGEGYLYDGHQRLRALLQLGRKRISADDVEVNPRVTAKTMMDFAIDINQNRRTITGKAKAACMHARVRRDGWSQRRIAKAFGMSQAGVSKLMTKYPPTDPYTTIVLSEDGSRSYNVTCKPGGTKPVPTPPPPPRPRPWEPDGSASLALIRARKALADNTPTDSSLNSFQRTVLRDLLRALQKDCGNFIDDFLTAK